MGFAKSSIANTFKAQGLIILANYAFTCWSLMRQNPAEQEPIRDTFIEPVPDHEGVLVVAETDHSSISSSGADETVTYCSIFMYSTILILAEFRN